MTAEPTDTQLLRAVANALWPWLQGGAWSTYRETRTLSPTGNPRRGWSTTPPTPAPTRTVEVISRRQLIITTLWRRDWPGDASWRITLDRADADARLARLPDQVTIAYEAALAVSTCRKPFCTATDLDGTRFLTRNRNDGSITHLVAAALESIARAATLKRVPDGIEQLLREGKYRAHAAPVAARRAARGLDRQDVLCNDARQ